MYRKTYLKINTETLKNNVKELVRNYNGYRYFFGVVKGNAYGHGMKSVNALVEGGVNYLAVSSLEEALKVREYNKETPVLCLEPVSEEFTEVAIKNNVTLTVDSVNRFEKLVNLNKKIKVHIKLDTGMNRLGIKQKAELEELFEIYKSQTNIFIEGIYTHLATSGINDKFYDLQIEAFKNLTENINLSEIPIVHIGRSISLVHHKKPDFVNGVRMGICMYGFSQSIKEPTGIRKLKRNYNLKRNNISESVLENNLKLNTAMELYSEVMAVKTVEKGEFVGYGAEYIAERDITVATLPIGYFDGVEKNMKYVFLNGKRCAILGEICMDMVSVLTDSNTKIGDKAEIFGKNISVKEVANNLGVSAYRVLTRITDRVERIY